MVQFRKPLQNFEYLNKLITQSSCFQGKNSTCSCYVSNYSMKSKYQLDIVLLSKDLAWEEIPMQMVMKLIVLSNSEEEFIVGPTSQTHEEFWTLQWTDYTIFKSYERKSFNISVSFHSSQLVLDPWKFLLN